MKFKLHNQVKELEYLGSDLIELYKRHADPQQSFIFEYNNASGKCMPPRFSVIGLSILASIGVKKNKIVVETTHGKELETHLNPQAVWPELESILTDFDIPISDKVPCFSGGWFGFFGYESVRYFEPSKLPDPDLRDLTGSQDINLLLPERLLIMDHQERRMWLVAYAFEGEAVNLTLSENNFKWHADLVTGNIRYQFEKPAFLKAVENIKQHIKDGEIMQAVLSQRMCVDVTGEGIHFFEKLRVASPSPYHFYVRVNDSCIFGASPETLISNKNGKLVSFPMAGTRHRSDCNETNQRLEEDLLNDEKECAEHLMLIDLARNDLGRVSKLASVEVPRMMSVEHFSHVMHITSEVRSQQLCDTTTLDLVKATLPAGTLSGAPKIRAMQLIDQYEPIRRGLYGGGIGILAGSDVDLAIVIRSALIKDGCLNVQAGAGVVADSIAENEWQETLNKSKGILCAIGIKNFDKEKGLSLCY
ncbi:anthranilate synthase component I family protein [Pseudoalteromonas rhizosphaerae]|uniref:Anthranilate synthase component 1 n=1 Tax=Pseudoalteromonas rhizosphaerae TaxID=2518973 RepID=A0ABW8L311_9GAMM